MKRGAITISQELLKEILKGRIPDDFLLSGVEFDAKHNNIIVVHGYSDKFHDTAESGEHMIETNIPYNRTMKDKVK